MIEHISKQESVKAVLAIHIYTTLKPVEKLIEAGAMGYLPQDTNQQQILDAVESLHRGEKFIGINKNTEVSKNT